MTLVSLGRVGEMQRELQQPELQAVVSWSLSAVAHPSVPLALTLVLLDVEVTQGA